MSLRAAVLLAVCLVATSASTRAWAWQEAHESGSDLTVRVEGDGAASVRDLVRWKVVRGPVKSIDLVNVDPAATLDPDVSITSEDGRALSGHLVRADERTVRVLVDQPKALMRGTFTFEARWRIHLLATHALVYDGANWRLTWSAPVASDGIDASRTVFDLPGAPEEPRAILADTGAIDENAVATLQRDGGRDALELVRPHVARGESASWTVRIDPRALPAIGDPAMRPSQVAPPPEVDRTRDAALFLLLGALAAGFGSLVARKTAAFAQAGRARGASPRALLPLPAGLRAAAAGAAFAGAVGCELTDHVIHGVLLAAFASLAASLRPPAVRARARGPGKWLALRPEDAFQRSSEQLHWMDASGPAGRATLALLAVATCAAAVAARRWGPEGPWLVVLDASATLPLFFTGRAVQLPPDGRASAARWIERAFLRLRGVQPVRAVPWGRVIVDSSTVDELRLLVLPRSAMPGVAGIEVGLGWIDTPVGWIGSPEVLLRVLDGSPAAARLAKAAPLGKTLPGRRTDERVLRAVPRALTPTGAANLAVAFADMMTDRRAHAELGPWTAAERRVAPSKTSKPSPAERAPVAA
jgi:hypothetical protein